MNVHSSSFIKNNSYYSCLKETLDEWKFLKDDLDDLKIPFHYYNDLYYRKSDNKIVRRIKLFMYKNDYSIIYGWIRKDNLIKLKPKRIGKNEHNDRSMILTITHKQNYEF